MLTQPGFDTWTRVNNSRETSLSTELIQTELRKNGNNIDMANIINENSAIHISQEYTKSFNFLIVD